MYVAACYLCYLAISIAITVWVAHTLHKNGARLSAGCLPRQRGPWPTP
jgi:hypothetical protein